METYYNPQTQTAYVTDGTHLTIHEIRDWPSVSSQAERAHFIELSNRHRPAIATRTQGNRLPNDTPT